MVLRDLIALNLFQLVLVVTRIGAALTVMPGFSGALVSMRFRLLLVIAMAVVVMPNVADAMPPQPGSPAALALLLIGEVTVGLFLGVITQALMLGVNLMGTFVGFQVGLANAMVYDPVVEQQSALLTGALANIAILVVFTTDTHHLMLRAVIESYSLFPVGQPLPMGDFTRHLGDVLTASFRIGMQMSAPVLVFGLVFHSGLGLMSRMVPAVPIFMVGQPAQILFGLSLLMIGLPTAMLLFIRTFEDGLLKFLPAAG